MSLPLVTASAYTKHGKLFIRDRAAMDSIIAELPEGLELQMEITRLRATRSQQANRYYWGVVLKALSELTGYTPEDLHDLMKAKFIPKELAITTGNGEVVDSFVLGGSTRQLDTKEFYEYVERIRLWANTTLGLAIPEPNEAL